MTDGRDDGGGRAGRPGGLNAAARAGKYLTFSLGNGEYGLPDLKVREIDHGDGHHRRCRSAGAREGRHQPARQADPGDRPARQVRPAGAATSSTCIVGVDVSRRATADARRHRRRRLRVLDSRPRVDQTSDFGERVETDSMLGSPGEEHGLVLLDLDCVARRRRRAQRPAVRAAAAGPARGDADDGPTARRDELAILPPTPRCCSMFVAEALDHLGTIESVVLQLETRPATSELLNDVFRPFHTIKGNAGALGVTSVQELAHMVENLLDLARAGKHAMGPDEFDIVLKRVDVLTTMMQRAAGARRRPAGVATRRARDCADGRGRRADRRRQRAVIAGAPELPADSRGGRRCRRCAGRDAEPPPSARRASDGARARSRSTRGSSTTWSTWSASWSSRSR